MGASKVSNAVLVLGGVCWLGVGNTSVTHETLLVKLVLLVTRLRLAHMTSFLAVFFIKNLTSKI